LQTLKITESGEVMINGSEIPYCESVDIKSINRDGLFSVILTIAVDELDIKFKA